MHHTGSQENEVGPEEQEETQEQELLGRPEPEGECRSARTTGLAHLRKASPGAFYVSLFSLT